MIPPQPVPADDDGTLFELGRRSPSWLGGQTSKSQPLAATPTGGELFAAGREASRNDRTDFETQMLADGYAPIVEALGLGKSQNPAGFYANQSLHNPILMRSELLARQGRTMGGVMADRATQEQLLADAIKLRRRTDPKFLEGLPDTVTGLRSLFAAQEKERRAKGLATLDRADGLGGWAAGFAGSASQALTDPVNVASLPIGGGGGTIGRIVLREALVNGVLEAVQQPMVAGNRAAIGEELSLGEAAANITAAGVAGGLLEGGIVGAVRGVDKGYDKAVAALFEALPASAQRRWADAAKVGDVRIGDFIDGLSHKELVAASRATVDPERMTPDELAATQVLERDTDVADASPYEPGPAGDAEHHERLAEAGDALESGRPLSEGQRITAELRRGIESVAAPTVARGDVDPLAPVADAQTVSRGTLPSPRAAIAGYAPVDGEAAAAQFTARVRRAESGGNDAARNPDSSATGRYQFTDATWLTYYKRRFGGAGGSDAQILAKRGDGGLQDRLMADLTADNRALLRRGGEVETAGNLYLAHFLGPRALNVLKAAPDRSVESVLPASFIAANRSVLAGKSASQVIAWAHRKMGGSAAAVPPRGAGGAIDSAGDDAMVAQLRSQAMAANASILGETNIPGVGTVPLYSARLRPADYGIDAARFQFKSGGDAEGVIDTLRGVKQWDPARSGRVLYWQDKEGAYWVADGHQRSGLAKRLEAEGAEVHVDGMVIREADGVSADDARSYGALLNILNKSADPVDAAKVLRGLGFDVDLGLPPRSALVRDATALVRLSDVAFGAVVNGRLAPDMAAMIGRILPDDDDAHETMIDLLIKLDPANTAQAESVIRQAMAAGMHREEQINLFGSSETVSSLFLDRARVLEKGLARLRATKLAYGIAAKEADTLERAGSTIARDASTREAQANAQAIEIVERVAYSAGPIADALNAAAARLAAGSKIADVVGEWVDAVRAIDLDELGADVSPGDAAVAALARGSNGLPPGRDADGGNFGDDEFGDAGGDLFAQRADPGEPELDAPGLVDEAAGRAFDDGTGDGPTAQSQSVEHDLRMDMEADGDGGFRLDPEGDERTVADIFDEIDADEAAATTLKNCLI